LIAAGWTVNYQGDEIMNVAIPPDLIGFVQAQVAEGHFSSEQEMIAQGLRLLKLQSERLADLRREIGIGIGALQRGEGIELDDASLADFFADIEREVQDEFDACGNRIP
jgi:putative addiction module CopG family antidote